MPRINKANRQVCDVNICDLATKKPVLFFETANSTTQSISGETVFAMAKGTKKIGFSNPIEGTATIEAQVYPFELYTLMSNGVIESKGSYAQKKTIECKNAGEIEIPVDAVIGTVFVYAKGSYGETEIKGAVADGKFTATTADDIKVGEFYEVGCIVSKNQGIKKISFNNKRLPKAYYITMDTIEKDENEVLTPYKIVLYKAQPQRNFELSQSSEGDPASITLTFDLLEDKDGNFMDMIEIEDEE